jgi:hypothetical protein
MNFQLVILNVLAKWPEKRIALDDVRREAKIIIASGDQAEQLRLFSAFGNVDIFQSGWASRDDTGLQITDAGLSLLQSLETSRMASLDASSNPTSPELRMTNDLAGIPERLRIFDLELRGHDNAEGVGTDLDLHQSEQAKRKQAATIGSLDVTSEAVIGPPEEIDCQIPDPTGYAGSNEISADGSDRTDMIESPDAAPQEAPAFLRRAFGSKIQEPSQSSSQLSNLFSFIAIKIQAIPAPWRRHFAKDVSNQNTERVVGAVTGAAFAFLSLISVVTCIGAAIALGQIKSLKSDIAMLHRELLPLRERLGKLEKIENTERDSNQQEEAQNKLDTEKNKLGGKTSTEQAALNLSREEIQLIRDYIKPAPSAGTGAPAINVGDPIGGATIPLPSPLTERVPRLVGAGFTTRNGAIIISMKNSRRADAVLAPN